MKKTIVIILVILLAISLYGCKKQTSQNNGDKNQGGNTEENNTDPEEKDNEDIESKTIQDFYPFADDKIYTYEGEGNEYASYIVYTEYLEGNKAQYRTSNGGTEVVKVLEYKDGQLLINLSEEETYYRENIINRDPDEEQAVLLKEPLAKGTEWTLPDGRKRYISNTEVNISTPLGEYKALEVTTEGDNDAIQDYYAEGIGLIKSIFTSKEADDYEVTSTLSKIEDNVPLTQQVRFFYPDIAADKNYYITKELSFHTNDITKKVLEDKYKELSKENFGVTVDPNEVIGKNVTIKSLYLNKDNKVYVDFSKEFTSEMNAGSGYESLILQSITNTLGEYYGKASVYITVEGEPYSGGHIVMEKGEAFEVNTEEFEEIKQ